MNREAWLVEVASVACVVKGRCPLFCPMAAGENTKATLRQTEGALETRQSDVLGRLVSDSRKPATKSHCCDRQGHLNVDWSLGKSEMFSVP